MTPRFWPGQRKGGAVISCGRSGIQYCHVESGIQYCHVELGPPSAVRWVGLSSKAGGQTVGLRV